MNYSRTLVRSGAGLALVLGIAACNPFATQQPEPQPVQATTPAQPTTGMWQDPKAPATGMQTGAVAGDDWDNDNDFDG
jgi:hypothetical protein